MTARASVDRRTGVTVRGALRATGANVGTLPAISAISTTSLRASAKAAAGAYGLVGVSGSEAMADNRQNADVTIDVDAVPGDPLRADPVLAETATSSFAPAASTAPLPALAAIRAGLSPSARARPSPTSPTPRPSRSMHRCGLPRQYCNRHGLPDRDQCRLGGGYGGLGGKPTAITDVTVSETSRISLEQSLSAAFGTLNVLATGSTLATANGRADFGGFASDVTGRANLTIDTTVEVLNSADLTASAISLAARQPTYAALALSSAKADAVGAKLTSFADIDARVVVRAVSDASATLATRELSMAAIAAPGAQVYARQRTDAAFISEDVTRETNNVTAVHEVVLNSRITIIPAGRTLCPPRKERQADGGGRRQGDGDR